MGQNSMITKQYTVKLGNELHISRLTTSNSPKNSILLKTNNQSERLELIENKDSIRAFTKQVGPRSISGNVSEILATDIVVDGVPYFYKWLKFSLPGYTIKYSEPTYEPSGMWIYSTSQKMTAIAVDNNNIEQFSTEIEMVPVFIDSRYLNLKDFIAMDGRYYTPKRKGDSILSSFSKDILAFKTRNKTFDAEVKDSNDITTMYIDEFVHEVPIKIDGRNGIVKYEYFPYQHTLIRSFKEKVTVPPDGNIKLSNKNLDLSNIFIKKINNTSTNITVTGKTSPMSGVVCVSTYMQSGILNDGDLLEIEYNYLFIDKPFVVIDCRKLNGDSAVHTYIGATSIGTRNVSTKYEKSFGCIVSQKDFLTGHVFDKTIIDISQTGAMYSYDYKTQNQISFIDGVIIESFYTSNIDKVDGYLNQKRFKSCGVFGIVDSEPTYVECGVFADRKDDFYDFEKYKVYSAGITILGTEDSAVPAGIGKVKNKFTHPITFNIDHQSLSNIFIKINVQSEEEANITLANPDIVQFCSDADEIGKDFSYNKNKITACYVVDGNDINVTTKLFFNNSTKELYAKVQRVPGAELRLKYAGMHSNYGIVV